MRRGVPSPPEGLPPPQNFFSRFLSSKRRVLVHSVTDKTIFLSAWRLNFYGQQPSGGGGRSPPLPSRRFIQDTTSASSYPSISYLSFLSKLLERLVVRQLMGYLSLADLLPPLQSGLGRVIPPKLQSCVCSQVI